MAVLDREAILKTGSGSIRTETLHVEEWGGDVLVRGMTGRQRDRFEASLLERRGKREITNVDNIRAKVVAQCLVGEDGERLFTDADADELGLHSASVIAKVYDVAARLSGISEEDLDELQGKIEESPFGGSPSSSPSNSDAPPAASSSTGATPTGSPNGGRSSSSANGSGPNGETGSPAAAGTGQPGGRQSS